MSCRFCSTAALPRFARTCHAYNLVHNFVCLTSAAQKDNPHAQPGTLVCTACDSVNKSHFLTTDCKAPRRPYDLDL